MRRVVSVLCLVALSACGGAGGSASRAPSGVIPVQPGNASAGSGRSSAPAGTIALSTPALTFTTTGWDAQQSITTTWSDDSRKSAVTSDPLVALVSPPFQLAQFVAPNKFRATYWITPVGAGTATITFSDHNGAESAQLTVTVIAPPTGTLYVAGGSEVDAFPAAANGPTVPSRRITGFYSPFVPTQHTGAAAAAIGTANDGTLYVLRDDEGTPSGPGECIAIPEGPAATGSSGAQSSFSCYGVRGYGAAPGPGSEIDLFVLGYSFSAVVQRFQNGNLQSSLNVPGTGSFGGVATDANGDVFVSSYFTTPAVAGKVLEYAPGATTGATPIRTISTPSGTFFDQIAVAPDGTLYAVYEVPNYSTGNGTLTIYAYAMCDTSPSRTIGPFTSDRINGLAVDRAGELYVAFDANDLSSSRVDVYAATANGNARPIRSIPNPIPADSVAGPGIVGISLSPPDPLPPQQVLNHRRRL